MKITLNDIQYMVNESVKHIIKEGWRPIYRRLPDGDYDYDGDEWDGVDDEEDEEATERQRIIDNCDYDAYVLVNDSDGAILANYTVSGYDPGEVYDEAIEDARQKAIENKFSSFSVYGCIDNAYDEDTLVFNTENNK